MMRGEINTTDPVRTIKPDSSRWFVDETGSVSIWAACAMAAIIMITLLVFQVGAATIARHRAQAGADFAALAAARALIEEDGDPCAMAEELAQANKVILRQCIEERGTILVTVAVPLILRVPGLSQEGSATSRAGPQLDDVGEEVPNTASSRKREL